jgi:hypothetical protein
MGLLQNILSVLPPDLSHKIAVAYQQTSGEAAVPTPSTIYLPPTPMPKVNTTTPFVIRSQHLLPAGDVLGGGGGLFGELTIATNKSIFTQHASVRVRPYAPDFRTQGDAAQYIASQMATSYNGPAVDRKVRDAVNEACLEWQPGMDLAKLVHDKVLAALQGVLPSASSQSGGGGIPGIPDFEFPDLPGLPDGVQVPQNPLAHPAQFGHADTAEAVADLMAAQIRANGSTVADVAEHLRNTPIDAPR